MRIRNQFLLTLLGATLAILVAMAGLVQLTLQRSLEHYRGEQQQATLRDLSAEFANYYSHYGSFDGIDLRTLIWNAEDSGNQRIPPDLVLLDADRYPLFGPPVPVDELALRAIRVDGNTVGWLGLPDGESFRHDMERHFARQQQQLLFSVGLVCLFLALFAAWWLRRRLVRPIEEVATLSATLAAGNYDQRLPSQRRDELGQLIQSMNQLADNLEQSRSSRQRWLADLSHELRTPVTVLRGELEAIQDGVRPMSAERIDSLHQEAMHLGALLDDLHDLALADAGALRYRMEAVDLTALVQASCEAFRPLFANKQQHLDCHLPSQPLWLHGDPMRLRQLVDNLLGNSLKYTDTGGQVRVFLSADGDTIRLRLEDSAPGVDDDHLPLLFDYLYRAETSRNRRTGGAGLGLAICQRIVQAHHGTITASHAALGGLRIDVSLTTLS